MNCEPFGEVQGRQQPPNAKGPRWKTVADAFSVEVKSEQFDGFYRAEDKN
jgi:hypothetical protein